MLRGLGRDDVIFVVPLDVSLVDAPTRPSNAAWRIVD
jgi:hypothetical protein